MATKHESTIRELQHKINMQNKKHLMESLANGTETFEGIQLSSSRVGLNRSRLGDSIGPKKTTIKPAFNNVNQQRPSNLSNASKEFKVSQQSAFNRFSLTRKQFIPQLEEKQVDQPPIVNIDYAEGPQYPKFKSQLSKSQLRSYYSSLQNNCNEKKHYFNIKHQYIPNNDRSESTNANTQPLQSNLQISYSNDQFENMYQHNKDFNDQQQSQDGCKIISMDDLDNGAPQPKREENRFELVKMNSSAGLSVNKGPYTQKYHRTKPSSSVLVSMISAHQ